jgi:crossover junction endodeoxyribonuclease RuvC
MRILGIDPGLATTGYGLVETSRSSEFVCVHYGSIRSDADEALWQRLKKIYDGILTIIRAHQPEQVAFEDVFYGHNVQTALKLGQARGAAVIAAINAGVEIAAYSPREVKQALTGFGAASKEQVQRMVRDLLKLKEPATPMDASDALAVAICHAQRWLTKQKIEYL